MDLHRPPNVSRIAGRVRRRARRSRVSPGLVMKVLCAACGAAFAVGDHLVRGKVVQFKCRKCRAAIRVDGTALSLSPPPPVPAPERAPPLPSAVADSLEIPAEVAPPASSASLRATPNRMALSAGVQGPSVDIDDDVIPISVDDFPWTDPSSDGEDIPESIPPTDVLSEPPPLSSRRSEDPGPLPNLPRERESFRAIMDLDGGLMQAGLGPMLRPPDILGALTSTEDAGPSGAVTTSAKPSQASSHRPDAGGMGKKITVAAACAVAGLIFYAARTRAPAVDSLGERTPPATEQEPAGPTAENPPPTPESHGQRSYRRDSPGAFAQRRGTGRLRGSERFGRTPSAGIAEQSREHTREHRVSGVGAGGKGRRRRAGTAGSSQSARRARGATHGAERSAQPAAGKRGTAQERTRSRSTSSSVPFCRSRVRSGSRVRSRRCRHCASHSGCERPCVQDRRHPGRRGALGDHLRSERPRDDRQRRRCPFRGHESGGLPGSEVQVRARATFWWRQRDGPQEHPPQLAPRSRSPVHGLNARSCR